MLLALLLSLGGLYIFPITNLFLRESCFNSKNNPSHIVEKSIFFITVTSNELST